MSVRPVFTKKLTEAGNIKGSGGSLIWINASNTTGTGKKVVLHNATTGTTDEVMQIAVPGDDSKFLSFPGGFYFSLGIRCGTLESGLVVTGAYE